MTSVRVDEQTGDYRRRFDPGRIPRDGRSTDRAPPVHMATEIHG